MATTDDILRVKYRYLDTVYQFTSLLRGWY